MLPSSSAARILRPSSLRLALRGLTLRRPLHASPAAARTFEPDYLQVCMFQI